jgi:hypothetical protein
MTNRTIVVLGLLLIAARTDAAPTVLTTCGQTVVDAVLAADLDCSGEVGFAVVLAPSGKLNLAGHQLISGDIKIMDPEAPPPENAWDQEDTGGGVACEASCRIIGGGGSIVSGVARHPNYLPTGILTYSGTVTISGTTITGYSTGIRARRINVDSCTFAENATGCAASKVVIANSAFTYDSTIELGALPGEFYVGVDANQAILEATTLQGGFYGVLASRMKLYGTSVTQMERYGVHGFRKIYAENSVIDGNCLNTGGYDCADVVKYSPAPPELVTTTCSTSARRDLETQEWSSWNVCALD